MSRRGLFLAPFDSLADPNLIGDLAAEAEARGWDGLFIWDHLLYGDRVTNIADAWTCCAVIAVRTERISFGPMVTPLARRRPQVVARQAATLATLSGGRFILGLGLGDDALSEFSAFDDEPDPAARGRMLDDGLIIVSSLLTGETTDIETDHYAARSVRFQPPAKVPIWLGGRYPNAAPLRRAARHDGFFVIDVPDAGDIATVKRSLEDHHVPEGFDVVVDVPSTAPLTPWRDSGATWVLTRIGPYDIDVDAVRRIIENGP